MSISPGKIVALMASKYPIEVRCSAVTVLGELGGRDAEVNAAILETLASEEPRLRLCAVRAAGQLKIEKALPLLIERISHGGPEGEFAAESAAKLGPKGMQALQELMGHVVPGVRKYIASALATAGADGAKDADSLEMLKDRDPHVVEITVATLASRIPTLSAKVHKQLADELFAISKDKKAKLLPAGEAGLVRLAAILDDPRVEPLLWDRTQKPAPPEVRAAALQALGPKITNPGKELRAKLFACASDVDFRVAAPALMILDKIAVQDKAIAEWLILFEASDLAARRFALGKLGDRDLPEVAEALAAQIRHPDRKYRDEVLAKLAGLPKGRKALTKPLKDAESAEEAWNLAKVVAPFAKGDAKTWHDDLFAKTCSFLESGDRRVDPLIYVLREAGSVELRDRLEAKGDAAKKKEDFEKALIHYKAAARDPAAGFSIRIGLATCGLKLSAKDLNAEARARDHALQQFADLIRQNEPETFAAVESAKWLGADELYYLGFNFVDHQGVMAEFGAKVLKLLVKKHGKAKVASSAKNKLKSSGQK